MAKFVSFVGTQVMGTFNPALSVMNLREPIYKFLFLYTDTTIGQTEKIISLLLKQNPELEIQKQNVSITFDLQNFPIDKNEEIYFNLSGGMNYQVANFVFQYFKYKVKETKQPHLHFIYSERDSIWSLNLSSGEYKELKPYIELEPLEILEIQGVNFKIINGNPNILELLKKVGRDSVIPIKLGDIEFDDIVSKNNFLKFIKFFYGKYDLDQIRKLIAFCGKNRKQLRELHSFETIVFTNNPLIEDRLKTEVIGDVKVIHFDRKNIDEIKKIFMSVQNKSTFSVHLSKKINLPEIIRKPIDGPTLYVVMSTELINTMKAIYTHKYSNLSLIYTPGNLRVKKIINKIKKGKINLPTIGGLQLLPTDITGFNLLNMKKFGNGETIINITPGPKSHAGILTFWGMQKQAKIYSINNSSNTIDLLDGSEKIPLKEPPLQTLLLITEEIKNIGKTLDKEKKGDYQALFDKFKELKNRVLNNKKLNNAEINSKINNILGRNSNKGHFFEELTAFAFEKIGCSEILIGIKTKWSEKNRDYLNEKYPNKPVKSEIDIACVFNGRYLVISCKISPLKSLNKITSEVNAQSEILGRMSLPMLVILKYHHPPYIKNGVTVIGWQTLFDEKELTETIQKTIDSKMTTKQNG